MALNSKEVKRKRKIQRDADNTVFPLKIENGGTIDMKKLIRSLLVVLITLSLAVGAYADNFSFLILCENTGYNSDPIYKDANIPHSKAMISVTYTLAKMLSEGQYFYNVIDVTRRTNFIVIASNGVQISNAINLGYQETGYSTFYSSYHAGNVCLRGNSTSTGVDYRVEGVWDPNCD